VAYPPGPSLAYQVTVTVPTSKSPSKLPSTMNLAPSLRLGSPPPPVILFKSRCIGCVNTVTLATHTLVHVAQAYCHVEFRVRKLQRGSGLTKLDPTPGPNIEATSHTVLRLMFILCRRREARSIVRRTSSENPFKIMMNKIRRDGRVALVTK